MPEYVAPTADYIKKLKARLEKKFGEQRKLDDKALDLYVQKHVMDVKQSSVKGNQVHPVGGGRGGSKVDQSVAVLGGPVFIKVAPRGGSAAERHASDTLEPFNNAALIEMEKEIEVSHPVRRDQVLYGRAFAIGPMPAPFFWGDSAMEELVIAAEEAGDDSKPEKRKAIEDYRASHFPIVWRHWDAPSVYPVFNDKGEPAEVVYCRKMCAADIKARWGDDAVPKKLFGREYDDDAEIEVVDYLNDKCVAVWIEGVETLAMYYEHYMGTCPVTYFGGGKLPANKQGWTWAGILFHDRELIQSEDETLTDIRTNIRDWTTAPPVIFTDQEARGQIEGMPKTVDVKADETVNMLMGEKVERFPVSQMSADVYQFLGAVGNRLNVNLYREALSGTGPSGQSAVHLTESNQIAKIELRRFHDGLERGYARAGRLIMRSVTALNEGLEYSYDKVVLRPYDARNKSKAIEVGPEDVKGWEDLVSAHVDLALPVSEGANVTNYKLAVESRGYDPYTAREVFLSIQNPAEIDDRWAEYELYQELMTIAKGIAVKRAMGEAAQQGAQPIEKLLGRAADLPPFVGETLNQFGGAPPANGTAPPAADAAMERAAANMASAGRGQQMSQLSGNDTMVP